MVIMIEEDLMAEDCKKGLPSQDELTPISHTLISPQLASVFCIDIGAIRSPTSILEEFPAFFETHATSSARHPVLPLPINPSPSTRGDEIERFLGVGGALFQPLSASPNVRLFPASFPSQDTTGPGENYENFCRLSRDRSEGGEIKCGKNGRDAAEESLKKPRLVWSTQLHDRFVEAVHRLGVNQAVPKAIMDLMGVDGVTRENVASHLQKYRLYLRRPPKSPPPSSNHFINFNSSSPTNLIHPVYTGSPPPANPLTLFPQNHH